MGNLVGSLWSSEPPPPIVLVPPIFDFPPLAARTRMLFPAYDLLFGKLALRCLFEDYFEQAGKLNTRIMLKPIEDPHVDLVATFSGPIDKKSGHDINGNAVLRWQRDLNEPNTFMDLSVSDSEPILCMRSSAYYPKFRLGAFGIFPLVVSNRVYPEDYGVMGLRYGSECLSAGTTFMPFPLSSETPFCAWLVGKTGRLTTGVKFKPLGEGTYRMRLKDLKNWSYTIGYGFGSGSPLNPSFNFSLEVDRNSQLIASFYQHLVVQRRVKNPLEESHVVGITNYVDFGFEFGTRIIGDKSSENLDKSSFQVAASWQANKNFLLKGKFGSLGSSIALAFKSWWNPSVTFSFSAANDSNGRKYGLGLRIEALRQASYERADPNYVMLKPNKEHLAEGVLRNFGKRPMFQSEIESGNYDRLPRELRPLGKIL
ncbi:uncharacterized protein LOC120251054 [Dioscorea cayenensis subsp. rotundata]|uniref:Uncharacterized protein LOC120251054 n=1 Tax=Dioscorea cayennensis subsp. rotundata TaxID=55577 RepID=A0AB40AKJ9_DIOCR|nr:uncharacterized protein LOC120251054 [Dioscorea cayenensis subsp. rotundata]